VIIVSKQKGVYRGDGIVTLTINKDMTGHDIKELVDKTIAEMN
jgi:ribosomal protein S19